MLSPLTASSLKIKDRLQLEEFLSKPEARKTIRAASFEEVFFVIKNIGLADTMELLPIVTGRQVCGFIDLDCWRKDMFVRKPFMEWIAAFVQAGPEETAKALSGIDETLIALFLKDLVRVYEVDRDDPPDVDQLISTPDERFAVEPVEDSEAASHQAATIGMLILDALFKFNPHLGTQVLTLIRYTSRLELEETAFDNKTRRLEVHGFVDYYDALSIYAGSGGSPSAADRDTAAEDVPGEEVPGNLPAVFAESLAGGEFLLQALEHISDPAETERLAQELTALGNRILSANLVNLGELEGIRPALEEMRDTLTIGLEHLTDGHPERAPSVFRKSYMQTVFKAGFDQMAALRGRADALLAIPDMKITMLDTRDQEFIEGLRRFKPLVVEDSRYRNFRSISDIEKAHGRLLALEAMVGTFLKGFSLVPASFARAFNTATIRIALYGNFDIAPLTAGELTRFVEHGFTVPEMDVPVALRPFADQWWKALQVELEPLVGQKIDVRFIETVSVQL
jgi:uncharacterized protein DUF6178